MTTKLARRMLYTPIFHIDTNLINSRGKLEAMNQIEKWAADEVILLNMSGVSFKEAQADADAARTKKALSQIFTVTDESIDTANRSYKNIEAALFPAGPKNENQRNDIKIVYEAAKYAAILVTGDGASKSQPGGILGNRGKLKSIVRIMNASEAVEFIKTKIAARDEFNRQVAATTGQALPEWTGKD
jgi:hypothetical protein